MKFTILLRLLFVFGLIILCFVLFFLFIRPDLASYISMNTRNLRILALTIISAVFLLGFLDRQTHIALRIVFLFLSFGILAESLLFSPVIHILFKLIFK
ncbi:MAG: hypothetical protein J7M18_03590 [Candidatus Eremiobacteraeota bacterium]|nr:hypothetical protein [Candidatus Eremiobacteraeota bacterium]